ncbi:MAG: hypothetical protein OER43_19805 [Gammaproteobacteria bacterium]|nr:hypothetical protein [Gammaproteobacteria bacterium]
MTPDRNPWLESLIRPNLRPYSERAPLALESVGRLLARLGNPQSRLRVIHIAGSKGKGSTALMIEPGVGRNSEAYCAGCFAVCAARTKRD